MGPSLAIGQHGGIPGVPQRQLAALFGREDLRRRVTDRLVVHLLG